MDSNPNPIRNEKNAFSRLGRPFLSVQLLHDEVVNELMSLGDWAAV